MSLLSRTGRNESCPCGSGKRFKHCCGALQAVDTKKPQLARDQIAKLQRRSASGDVAAMARLGLAYLTADGTPGNVEQGIKLVDEAAAGQDPQGAALAATIRATSLWRERDWSQALDYLVIAARGGHYPSQGALRIIAAGPDVAPGNSDSWEDLRAKVDLLQWLTPPPAEILRESPSIHSIGQFISVAACNWLVDQVRGRLERSTIYDKRTGGSIVDARRINSQSELSVDNMGLLTFLIRARIAVLLGRSDEAMEIPKVLHYAPGETFAPHYDFLDPEEPAYVTELAQRGQRTETFLIYLNDEYVGGETHFTELRLSHRGVKGDALWFGNLDESGSPDFNTRHAGLPPTSGEKWLFSQWIREK